MKSTLLQYTVFGILNLYVIYYAFLSCLASFNTGDTLFTIMWSILFSFSLNDFINRQRNFVKYYPNFSHLWLP